MLRAPVLPLETLDQVANSANIDDTLKQEFSNDLTIESIYLASPVLYRNTISWIKEADSNMPGKIKIRLSLLKYLIRMSSRCTPFGLFAGISVGRFSDHSSIKINKALMHKLFVRPDMQYQCTLVEKLSRDQSVWEGLKFYPNTSLYKIGNACRYIEYFTSEEGIRKYQLQEIQASEAIDIVIDKAHDGKSIAELANALSDHGAELDDCLNYIHTLIDNQVIVSNLEPMVTVNHYCEEWQNTIHESAGNCELSSQLLKMNHRLKHSADVKSGKRMEVYQGIKQEVANSGLPYNENSLFQADLKLSVSECELSYNIRKDLTNVLPVLEVLSRPATNSLLDNFKKAFERRYGDNEMPLNILMDAETGPGYLRDDKNVHASTLLEGIKIPGKRSPSTDLNWQAVDRLLLHKLQLSLLDNKNTIYLTDEDLDSLPRPRFELPYSISIMAKVYKHNKNEGSGDLVEIKSAGGSSAANLAARFCYMDEKLKKAIEEITSIEQKLAEDVILAEIVHLPQQRTGNILMRPILRDYEIPYLARSSLSREFRINMDDLMVSVKHGHVMLRSQRLKKYIIPRLSNAHNYSLGSLAVYRFLCDLQTQDVQASLSFSWGPLENEFIFLPRLCYRNFILQSATWHLGKRELEEFVKARDARSRLSAMNSVRNIFGVPEKVILSVFDNDLWLDLGNDACLMLFQKEIKKMKEVCLREFIFDSENALVQRDGQHFSNEFVFFAHRNTA